MDLEHSDAFEALGVGCRELNSTVPSKRIPVEHLSLGCIAKARKKPNNLDLCDEMDAHRATRGS